MLNPAIRVLFEAHPFARKSYRLALFLLLAAWPSLAQEQPPSLVEKLGYPRDAKLLIVHADDVGMTHSVNAATIAALESGAVNSASIMVPCPWFLEIAAYAKAHPAADFGLHLTLTSERVYYRWGPVASRDQVPSLLDELGYFHLDWTPAVRIDPQQVELELRAQIEHALASGIRPTHLDSHQYRLMQSGKELFEALLRVAHDYHLPVFVARDWFTDYPYLETSLTPADLVLTHTVTITSANDDHLARKHLDDLFFRPDHWADFYIQALRNLRPGITEFVIHLAYANDEMRAATRERDTWGAAWRQRDFDFFTSRQFRQLLKDQNIHLITWRELSRATR